MAPGFALCPPCACTSAHDSHARKRHTYTVVTMSTVSEGNAQASGQASGASSGGRASQNDTPHARDPRQYAYLPQPVPHLQPSPQQQLDSWRFNASAGGLACCCCAWAHACAAGPESSAAQMIPWGWELTLGGWRGRAIVLQESSRSFREAPQSKRCVFLAACALSSLTRMDSL